jgi:hypothetical protein
MFQKKQEHHHLRENLTQKDLFDRKIKIAESAVAQFSTLKILFSMMRQILDTILHAIRYKLPLDKDVFLNATNELGVLFERAKSYDTSSVSLYFHIKDISTQPLIQDFLNSTCTMTALTNSLDAKTKDQSITKEYTIKIVPSLITLLVFISKLLKSVEDDLSENIQKIKKDMQEFQGF